MWHRISSDNVCTSVGVCTVYALNNLTASTPGCISCWSENVACQINYDKTRSNEIKYILKNASDVFFIYIHLFF